MSKRLRVPSCPYYANGKVVLVFKSILAKRSKPFINCINSKAKVSLPYFSLRTSNCIILLPR